MTIRLNQGAGTIDYPEWYFLITGGVVVENPHKNPAKEWLSEKAWGAVPISRTACFSRSQA